MGLFSVMSKTGGYAWRALKIAPSYVFSDGSKAYNAGVKAAKSGSVFKRMIAGGKALERAQALKKGNIISRVVKNLVSVPKSLVNGAKVGSRAARIAGKSTFIGASKGFLKGAAKKMPYIGAILTAAIEAPNIINAFKKGGVKAGFKELGGAGIELGSMAAGTAAGAAIGSIIPGVGTVIGGAVGGLIGGIVGMFARGKTYSEKEAEKKAKLEEQSAKFAYSKEEIEALKEIGLSEDEINYLQECGYSFEEIVEEINTELEKAQKEERQNQPDLSITPSSQNNPFSFGQPTFNNNPTMFPSNNAAQIEYMLQNLQLNNPYAEDIYAKEFFQQLNSKAGQTATNPTQTIDNVYQLLNQQNRLYPLDNKQDAKPNKYFIYDKSA